MTVAICMIVISQKWVYTSLAILFMLVVTVIYFGVKQKLYLGVLIPQFVLIYFLLTYLAFFCERRSKTEFLRTLDSMELQTEDDFKNLIEQVPESILLFDPDTHIVSIMNNEMKKLMSKYSRGPAQNEVPNS
jgi:c-di-AMP phosphodiesterase-like protein